MAAQPLHHLSLAVAIVAVTAAAVLGALNWRAFRNSPLGAVLLVLTFAMGFLAVEDTVAMIFTLDPMVETAFHGVSHTLLLGLVVLLIRLEHRIKCSMRGT